MVSVLMSVYREPVEWVEEAIFSVLQQSYSDFEFIIIIDDPNNEAIISLIRSFSKTDHRVKFHRNEKNLGLTKSLNVGLALCKGKYIVRMDADDISLPGRIESQVKFMEENIDIVASGTAITKFGKENQTIVFESDSERIEQNFVLPSPIFPPIAHPTAIIRVDVLIKHNIRYNEVYTTSQDYGLWNDLVKIGKISNLDTVFLKYRVSDQQITAKKREIQKKNRNLIIRDHISYFVSKEGEGKYVVPEIIDLRAIRELKKITKNVNNASTYVQLQNFILCYYFSLTKYNSLSLIYFISTDFFNKSWSFKDRVRIFLSHFSRRFVRAIITPIVEKE